MVTVDLNFGHIGAGYHAHSMKDPRMHVSTQLQISPENVWNRIDSAFQFESGNNRKRTMVRQGQSIPPKFLLAGVHLTFPPSAEVAVHPLPTGSEIVLRLMWGSLPAPFPRVIAALGVAMFLATAVFSEGSPQELLVAAVVALVPIFALLYQRGGEREIQSHFSALLDGARFAAKPH